jgi:hypothetical protein
MLRLDEFIPFVNQQLTFHEMMVTKTHQNPRRSKLHQETAERFKGLLAAIVEAKTRIEQQPKSQSEAPKAWRQLSLTLEDVAGLPEELLNELSISEGDKTDFAIISIMNEMGGVSTIDRILIGLYRKTNEIHKRSSVNSRVYRLVQKGNLFTVPGKKGIYSTSPLSQEEAADTEQLAAESNSN